MRERVFLLVLMAAVAAVVWFGKGGGWRAPVDDGVRAASRGSLAVEEARVSFDRDIRPLLSDRCFQCHGGDEAKRQADLRLDLAESAVAARKNGPAVVPGKREESGVWRHITSDDPDEVMPPLKSSKRALSEAEQELVGRWIDEGAVFEAHWSFVPPVRPALPVVKDGAWGRNGIDSFILAGLEAKGFVPSAEADKGSLLRRVFLDLTGLPPTADQVAAFVADPAPDAYEKWVDRLLAEEPFVSRYAERMATPWLDQARYADTSGIHRDQGRSIWPWRDWVLRAYRENMRFDEFVKEQLAGDLFPGATVDQRVATGFCRAHVTSDEGGAIDEEYLLEYGVDRVSTAGSVFFGLTLGCARCHDHKFDPVSSTDFYSMISFFNSIEERGIDEQVRAPDIAFPPSITITRPEDQAKMDSLRRVIAEMKAKGDAIEQEPGQAGATAEFIAKLQRDGGVRWLEAPVVSAEAAGGAVMTVQADGSVLASGANPSADEHRFVLRTESTGVRMVLVEGLREASNKNLVGRGPNGNVVVTKVRGEAVSVREPSRKLPVKFSWVWANVEQTNVSENFRAANLLVGDPTGWAVRGHEVPGDRVLMLLMEQPVGFEGGTEVHLTVEYQSPHVQHVFARTRVRLGEIGEAGLASLPTMFSPWYVAGPFAAETSTTAFEQEFGPESVTTLDLNAEFADLKGKKKWAFERRIGDTGKVTGLSNIVGSEYIARQVYASSARRLSIAVGSDDGIRILANGKQVYRNDVERSLTPEQDKVSFDVGPGITTVVYKVVNTGGPDGFAHVDVPSAGAHGAEYVGGFLPDDARTPEQAAALGAVRLRQESPQYGEIIDQQARAAKELSRVEAGLPRTMVMKERKEPRQTFVMKRGRYDDPDMARPVKREIPAFLGKLKGEGSKSRMDLAEWMVGEENPLLARVTVNRVWEQLFSSGIVRTTEDFGYQGEYPSHPGLLDWLAVEFREKGWDTKGLVRLIVTSSTYRQASLVRPEVAAVDPENRLLAYFPRQRLSAEQLRDQALFVSGLLVEKFGGPSVRPYQPAGLWEEVAMPDSPTRVFAQDTGEGLWRRSLYTYWKRASPPPSMLAFDAPTRESCVVRRMTTNTPLQALVLWNDVQFIEAARVLGARVVRSARDDEGRIRWLLLTVTSRAPSTDEMTAMLEGLKGFRERYEHRPGDASRLLRVGEAGVAEDITPAELASWTMVCNAVLSSDAAIVKR